GATGWEAAFAGAVDRYFRSLPVGAGPTRTSIARSLPSVTTVTVAPSLSAFSLYASFLPTSSFLPSAVAKAKRVDVRRASCRPFNAFSPLTETWRRWAEGSTLVTLPWTVSFLAGLVSSPGAWAADTAAARAAHSTRRDMRALPGVSASGGRPRAGRPRAPGSP